MITWRLCLLSVTTICLQAPRAVAQGGGYPWHTNPPPWFVGPAPGDSVTMIQTQYGQPDSAVRRGGVRDLYYTAQGLVFVVDGHERLYAIEAISSAAVQLDSIGVGASRDSVVKRWGPPDAVQGHAILYITQAKSAPWALALVFDNKDRHMTMLSLTRGEYTR